MQQQHPTYQQQMAPQPNVQPQQASSSDSQLQVGAQHAPQHAYYPTHDQNAYQYADAGYCYPTEGAPMQLVPSTGVTSWFEFSNSGYLKGFLVGVGVTLVVTNPAVQKTIVTGAVKLWSAFQGGVEEIKEHVQDVKAEVSQKKA